MIQTAIDRLRYASPAFWRGVCVCGVAFVSVLYVMSGLVHARDMGQWSGTDPAVTAWFKSLMQPDSPAIPCCGEADAYWADTVETKDGQLIAVITDDRPDGPLGRHHVPVGTKIPIPQHKIKWDQGNPTGHIIVFLSYDNSVYCYVQAGGV